MPFLTWTCRYGEPTYNCTRYTPCDRCEEFQELFKDSLLEQDRESLTRRPSRVVVVTAPRRDTFSEIFSDSSSLRRAREETERELRRLEKAEREAELSEARARATAEVAIALGRGTVALTRVTTNVVKKNSKTAAGIALGIGALGLIAALANED